MPSLRVAVGLLQSNTTLLLVSLVFWLLCIGKGYILPVTIVLLLVPATLLLKSSILVLLNRLVCILKHALVHDAVWCAI